MVKGWMMRVQKTHLLTSPNKFRFSKQKFWKCPRDYGFDHNRPWSAVNNKAWWAATQRNFRRTVAQLCIADPELSMFGNAIKEQPDVLQEFSLPGSYTLFAPTNRALSVLSENSWNGLAEKDGGRPMSRFLRNHAIRGFFTTKELRTTEEPVATLSGEELPRLEHRTLEKKLGRTKIPHPVLSLGNTKLTFKYDWRASNGIVHVIDYPLIPKDMLPNPLQNQT